MSTDFQITIPDFDDDEYTSTPTLFGRPGGNPFGGGGGSSLASGQDSPTSITPMALPERAERSYFHARADSYTSDDSSHSVHSRYTPTRPSPFSQHSSSMSTMSGGAPTKKSSFASIRNAFKSGKSTNHDAPPVPALDRDALPVLKNPFNRSTSSLAQPQAPPTPLTSRRQPSSTASPPYARTPTPGSGPPPANPRPPRPRRPQHSYSGSAHTNIASDSSDHGHAYRESPPPVPRMPGAFGLQQQRSESPDQFRDMEDKIVMDPRTPADYALHAVFMRFAASAEAKINAFLREPLDSEPLLPEWMGPDVDPKFDELLNSLGKIAQKHCKPVVDSVMRWRKSQTEPVPADILRMHASQSPSFGRAASNMPGRSVDMASILSERRALANIYVMCRALVAVLGATSRDALGDQLGYNLEETMFEQFKKPDLKLLMQSANHRSNADLYAQMLGLIAKIRFESVTDRFIKELDPVASGQVPKDSDMKYENLVKGLRQIEIKVWPPEAFEEAAEFMESLSKSFANAHGLRLKTSFAETLVHLLHPMGKTAQAEVNHPQWAKAIEIIYPKAKDMMSKPRYWPVAYPLAITSLCMAPHQFFLKQWTSSFDAGASRLKEKQHRTAILNGLIRLAWTYLFRCQESSSTSIGKMDGFLKKLMPSNRTAVLPAEEALDPFVFIVHFFLSRHFDQGRDFCLELMSESTLAGAQPSSAVLSHLAPDKVAIAVQAFLLSLHVHEREEPTPAWPSNVDFSVFPTQVDYPSSSELLPPNLLSKPGMQEFFDRAGSALAVIASSVNLTVGNMSIFDEQWALGRLNPAYDDSTSFIVRRHAEGAVAYPNHLAGQVALLQTCFQAWPRLLHSSLPLNEAVDMLLHGIIHVEPSVGEIASASLKRFMHDAHHASAVLSRYAAFLFGASQIAHEGKGIKLALESPRLLNLWYSLLDQWVKDIVKVPADSIITEDKDLMAKVCDESEAGALFLLSHEVRQIHAIGVKAMRLFERLHTHISPMAKEDAIRTSRIVDIFHGQGLQEAYLYGYDDLLDKDELERLQQWRLSTHPDVPLRLGDSKDPVDRALWKHVFPALMKTCIETPGPVLNLFRETLVAAASRYHPLMAHIAGLSSRVPAGLITSRSNPNSTERDGSRLVRENMPLVEQWHLWVNILCSIAFLTDARPAYTYAGREHARAPSDASFERERMTTTRGLFRYLTPFLDSEYTPFRNAAVLCISSLPASGYAQLLEDLNLLAARQFYDDSRIKLGAGPPARTRRQERLHSAVARIYFLTADFLRQPRLSGRPAALAHVLKFVRSTQSFLTGPDMRDNHTLQRLRRYFCGTIERLFDGMATLKDSDRFIPSHMHLSLYRLCEEWCQYGPQSDAVKQRSTAMQRACAVAALETNDSYALERFQHETRLLSNAAAGALTSLCQKAFFPPELSSGSPSERTPLDYRSLEVTPTLERLDAIIQSTNSTISLAGRKGLRSLLAHPGCDSRLLDESLRRAFVASSDQDSRDARFFAVLSEVICNAEEHSFTFSQVVCLGLSNLCHPLFEIRRQAFGILETIHVQSSGILPVSQFEASIGSSSPSAYLRGHRLISDCLAGEHPEQASSVLSQFAGWLPMIRDTGVSKVVLFLLQSLEGWIANIDVMGPDPRQGLSREGSTALYHLVSLTLRYASTHSEQILVLWTRLVESHHQSNGHATVRFLLEQSHRVGTAPFIGCSANIVACIAQTAVGHSIVQELCSLIVPVRMLPTYDHKLNRPDVEDMELWSDLNELFAEQQPRLTLGAAQFALLFLADVALERQWELHAYIPVILHALFLHLDHRNPFVRRRAQRMLFQVIRAWLPGYDELPDKSAYPSRWDLKVSVDKLEQDSEQMFWKEEDSGSDSEPKMQWLCSRVLACLLPLMPQLSEQWGLVALNWGTSCAIRTTAFRSLQIFRAILPRVNDTGLGVLLGRLANTISGAEESIQSFTLEMILTLGAIAMAKDLDMALFPRLFWCAAASLATTVEQEFLHALTLMEGLVSRVDLEDPHTAELLVAHRPLDWAGSATLQSSLLKGLRSSLTFATTFKILQALTKVQESRLVDDSGGRVRDLYTVSLPWCLHAMATDSKDAALQDFAMNIARLAEDEGRRSISRIMESFVKNRFRTKDDFLRQSVSTLREHYGADSWSEVVTLLLGLVLNPERWLRVQSLQILKVLFQQRETKNPVDLMGAELLMPLLRILETDLATEALEVLEEPMAITGGLAAKHVLRMSMRPKAQVRHVETFADIFGVPEESGWCVARAESLREICRSNLIAVFDTCKMPSRPSRIDFEPEVTVLADTIDEDLGGLVQNLHELTTFFQDNRPRPTISTQTVPSQQLEARVAAILAKSTEPINDVPLTPFEDVFRIDSMEDSFDSDEDSDPDSDDDAFVFDSPALYHSAPNGLSMH